MDSKTWTAIGIVAIIAIAGAVVWASLPESVDDDRTLNYQYDVVDVRWSHYSTGDRCIAEIVFTPGVDEGVTISMSYHGVPLGSFTTTSQGGETSRYTLEIFPTETMDLDDIRENMVIQFS